MFDFMSMAGNYEDRKVARDELEWGFVSTAEVNDGVKPFETAVRSKLYARVDKPYQTDDMIIVEAYQSREEAAAGHTRWVAAMTGDNPPKELVDCCNSGVGQMLKAINSIPREVRI